MLPVQSDDMGEKKKKKSEGMRAVPTLTMSMRFTAGPAPSYTTLGKVTDYGPP